MLSNEELQKINGGAVNKKLLAAIGAAVTFIFSVIDGYFRPLACNK